jgi:hypothetical protein
MEEKYSLYGLVKSKISRVLYKLIWESISLNTVMQHMRSISWILFLDSKSQG